MATTREEVVVSAAERFEQFYRRERGGLYRALALTIGDADLAAEAVDEAMTRALERWRRVRRYDNPAGWVYRVGLNWAISRLRRDGRAVPVPVVEARERRDRTPSEVTPEAALPDEVLAAALGALPPAHRAVVVLRYHLDWSVEGIANALDMPAGTVKSRLHRALAKLREGMEAAR